MEGLDHLRALDYVHARKALERVIELDPGFPLAHSALSEVWSALGYDARAKREAATAKELAGELPQRDQLLVEARFYAVIHDWARAAEAYGALRRLDPDNLEHALALAELRLESGRADLALEIIEALRTLPAPHSMDPRLDLMAATIAHRKGRFDQILEPATRAAERAAALGARQFEARAYNRIAVAHFRKGDLAKALEVAHKASVIFEEIGDRMGTTTSMRIATTVFLNEGRIDEAVEMTERALAIAREVGSQSEISLLLGHLGTMETRRGQFVPGREYALASIEVSREIGNRRREGISLIYLAGAYAVEGALRNAEDACQRAAWILSEIGNEKWEAQARSSLAHIMRRQGRVHEALAEAEKAVAMERGLGDRVGLAIGLDAQGWALLILGRMDLARACFDEVNELGVLTKHRTIVSRSALGRAVLLRAEGKLSAAEDLLRGALETHDAMNEKPQGALVAMELAKTVVAGEDSRGAVSAARAAVERFAPLGIRDGQVESESLLSRALLKDGDLDGAIHAAGRARQRLPAVEDRVASLEARIVLAEVDAARGQQDRAREQLRRLAGEARTLGCSPIAKEAESGLKRLDR